MSRYNVQIYYHGCFNVDVEATSENEAIIIAREKANSLDDIDFLGAIEIIENGTDIYPYEQDTK
jgi:hypothetical protein